MLFYPFLLFSLKVDLPSLRHLHNERVNIVTVYSLLKRNKLSPSDGTAVNSVPAVRGFPRISLVFKPASIKTTLLSQTAWLSDFPKTTD